MNTTATKPPAAARPWVVVCNPGQANELVMEEFIELAEAQHFLRFNADCDLMKRLPDGALTTEF